MGPRIFYVTDDHFFAAYSERQALDCALKIWGMEESDEDAPTLDEVHAITDEGMDHLEVMSEDGRCLRTFRDGLASEIAQGVEIPFYFCGRE